MCGFCGVFADDPFEEPKLRKLVEGMAAPLHHRGPDDARSYLDDRGQLGFGFRRLAILDLSPTGSQPMTSASGRFIITFNGEVYNFPSIRDDLKTRGIRFSGTSDTEVVVNALDVYGVRRAVRRLRGMFAFAAWDRKERKLTLVRDRLGIKPLYVYHRPGLVAFASELRALFAVPGFDADLSPGAVASYLANLYFPTPLTPFKSVRKLYPAHTLTLSTPLRVLPEPVPYWSVTAIATQDEGDLRGRSSEDLLREFKDHLRRVIRLRMRSDVPLGALLSGGIDSSTVTAVLQSLSARPVKTFTVGFDEPEHDESSMARGVAQHLGTDHTELQLSGEEALEFVPRLPEIFDEPLADPSGIPTYLISNLARRSVTVALSGDGGDEVFAGYNRYLAGERLLPRLARTPFPVRRIAASLIERAQPGTWERAFDAASRFVPGIDGQRLVGERIYKIARILRAPDQRRMYRSLLAANPSPGRLVPGAAAPSDRVDDTFLQHAGLPLLSKMQCADQLQYLPDDLLAKVDRASMAVSLEVRVPLLDHELVEFAWRLPREMKVRNGTGKWILRRALYQLVPRELVDRPKTGFTVPLAEWLRGPLQEWTRDHLFSPSVNRDGLLDDTAVEELWTRFQSGRSDLALGVWTVALLQAWRGQWL